MKTVRAINHVKIVDLYIPCVISFSVKSANLTKFVSFSVSSIERNHRIAQNHMFCTALVDVIRMKS